MTGIPLLSAFYFGSVEHYALLAKHPKVIIDIGEHYERQSYRTRTSIVGPNGVQHLNVQIARDHGNKMPMREVGLSYVETWPQQHLHAIRSAYGNTPWFIHYIDEIERVVMDRYERLVDLNMATLRLAMGWLALNTNVAVSDGYVEVNGDTSGGVSGHIDLRTSFHPKRPIPSAVPRVPTYAQIFADRHGALCRMSVIDLVMNQGPESRSLIRG